jgi:ribosome recycling factor
MSEFDINSLKSNTNTKIDKTLEVLDRDLQGLRTGKATPAMLDNVRVDNFGQMVPIHQIGSIATSDATTLTINLWDKNTIKAVEAAIQTSGLGINPVVSGTTIRLPIPPLTEERRKDFAKKTSEMAEKAKIAIRQIRQGYLETLKTAQKNKMMSEDELKRETDSFEKEVKSFSDKIDAIAKKKAEDIMKF